MENNGGTPGWLRPALVASFALFALTCSVERETSTVSPVYRSDVEQILTQRCAACHSGDLPKGGWNATTYLGAIGCVAPSNEVAILPPDGSSPVLRALDDDTHKALTNAPTAEERARLTAWVRGGARAFQGSAHPPGIIDPRSDAFHGKLLRAQRWLPMTDPRSPAACGRCHEGAPSGRPDGVVATAPGATSCRACHTDANGPLGCSTCHGDGTRAAPPRDLCFFPGDAARAGAHLAHVNPGANHTVSLPCSTCHTTPNPDDPASILTGLHANGTVEINFDPKVVTAGSYDPQTKTCTVSCHQRGGTRPIVAWADKGPLDCNSCHTSPPKPHYTGQACTFCHREANATGTALSPGPLHMNGRVDLGDGSGKCGACHGTGDDPWPSAGSHPAHRDPKVTTPLACASCHTVPTQLHDPGHMNGTVDLVFGGHALDRGSNPQWNGTSCTNVGCHGAGLAAKAPVTPVWGDPKGGACGACHGIPPTSIHTPSKSCDRVECHGAEIVRDSFNVPMISTTGRALHIDGIVEHQ